MAKFTRSILLLGVLCTALTLSACSSDSKEEESSTAQNGDTVSLDYTGKLADGTEFDTSLGKEPISFVLGEGEVIPGFENAVVGMKPNESKTVNIPMADAYGAYREDLVQDVTRSQFPADSDPQVGDQFQTTQPDGGTLVVTVKAVSGETVTLDANHMLAGKDLVFDITLLSIE